MNFLKKIKSKKGYLDSEQMLLINGFILFVFLIGLIIQGIHQRFFSSAQNKLDDTASYYEEVDRQSNEKNNITNISEEIQNNNEDISVQEKPVPQQEAQNIESTNTPNADSNITNKIDINGDNNNVNVTVNYYNN